ncbi:MAG: hypothetical protein ACTH1D_06430 [Mycobacteriaceae bacterium]|uniref:hypothetical protein n=1 Tax=Corynebacterium sp. TaxID=1720 RepID=UPI003F9C64A8
MKNRTRILAAAVAMTAGLSITACSSDDDDSGDNGGGTTAAQDAQEQEIPTPAAADLQVVIDEAMNPEVPPEEKANTVEEGETAVELFDVMIASQQESGATFEIVDPVLPGITPQEVTATANLVQPDQEPIVMDGVQFINENGEWKLSREWACTLVQNVAPDDVPPMCGDVLDDAPAPEGEAPAPEGEAPAPAPE